MRVWSVFGFCILAVFAAGCDNGSDIPEPILREFPGAIHISVQNPAGIDIGDTHLMLALDRLHEADPEFNPNAWAAFADGRELSGQLLDRDLDGSADHLLLIVSPPLTGSATINLRYAPEGKSARKYTQRAYAELSHKFGGEFGLNEQGRMIYKGGAFKNVDQLKVPPEHTDHSLYIRYEGPGWESDKIGYRFYLDWRNATDIFGKKVSRMVLKDVGQDGFDSYHEMSDWGMDVLKVGDALGIGAVGWWDGSRVVRVSKTDSIRCTVTDAGPVYARIHTEYYGWQAGSAKYDLTDDLSICAGERKTLHRVAPDPAIENLCTGIVRHEGVRVLKDMQNDSGWGYLATYGLQSLAGDSLGMAVLFRNKDVLEVTKDDLNQVVVFKPINDQIEFYFLGAWEQEPGGIRSWNQFKEYLAEELSLLNQPVTAAY